MAYDDPTPQDYMAFGRKVAALLGGSETWDLSANYLDVIADYGKEFGLPDIGSDRTLRYWRPIAAELGVDTDL